MAQGFVEPAQAATAAFSQERWDEVVRILKDVPDRSSEAEYEYGVSLAQLGRWQDARRSLESGQRRAPRDKRFPAELAGIAFRNHSNGEAKRYLRRALVLDPRDTYANNFLATLYFLDGNFDAALKYWNRIDRPVLENVASDPVPRLNPTLLDRAFAFAPGTTLTTGQYHRTQQELALLRVFPNFRFEVIPRQDDRFDLLFRASERNGWGDSKLGKAVNLFRQLPFQTITPEYYNWRRSGANFLALYRFDAQKRRVFADYSAPLGGDPKWRYGFGTDLRKENWDVTSALSSVAPQFALEKAEINAHLESIVSPNWRWTTAVQLAARRFHTAPPSTEQSAADAALADSLRNGVSLKYLSDLTGTLLRVPEKRFVTNATTHLEFGRNWASSAQSFAKVEAGVRSQWLPQARGEDYALSAQFRAGKTFGAAPFDELFMLGVERDNNLWLRAHPGTSDGRKGSAPIGSDYLLLNTDWEKKVMDKGFLRISVGPFFDAGRVYDRSPMLGSGQWLFDTGAQIKVRVLGNAGFVLVFGRDLRGRRNTFYPSSLR